MPSNKPIFYIDRETGTQKQEIVYGEKELNFLYRNRIGQQLRKLFVTQPWFSTISAYRKRNKLSARQIQSFVKKYDVDVTEASKPLNEYKSLDDFFCRQLKPNSRPIDTNKDSLASPADGRILAYRIDKDLSITIKNQHVSIPVLFNSLPDVNQLADGYAIVIRLAPKDYHRFHFPADGVASKPIQIHGSLESVHPIALSSGAKSFANKRSIVILDSTNFGRICLVSVGALTVGTIIQTYSPGQVSKGQEQGYFRFGGSTVVMLCDANKVQVDEDILNNSSTGIETLVKFGTKIATTI